MSEEKLPPRPSQVTLASYLVIGGCALAVVRVFETIRSLHSLETRQSVSDLLADAPFSGSGLSVGDVLDAIHVLALVAGACAVTAAILAGYVLRGDRRARVALSVVAVPLLLAGLSTAGFSSTFAAAAVVLLWLQPARDWFDGVVREAPPAPAPPPSSGPTPPSPPIAPPPPPPLPPPAPLRGPTARPGSRPGAVVWAAVLTWIGTGLTAAGMLVSALVVAADPAPVLTEVLKREPSLADRGVDEHMLVATMWVVAGVVLVLCASAAVLALLLWRRVAWARTPLVVLGVLATLAALVATMSSGLLVLGVGMTMATVGLLVRPDVREWLTGRQPR
ncbi:MAG: hypothetical protein QM638_10510 [Nocardioides sp.]|uniref:hypothetical protein n=1 Tax=Nocardioides sp. TaxID=35761 RepID=UPI0039E595AE